MKCVGTHNVVLTASKHTNTAHGTYANSAIGGFLSHILVFEQWISSHLSKITFSYALSNNLKWPTVFNMLQTVTTCLQAYLVCSKGKKNTFPSSYHCNFPNRRLLRNTSMLVQPLSCHFLALWCPLERRTHFSTTRHSIFHPLQSQRHDRMPSFTWMHFLYVNCSFHHHYGCCCC